MYVSLLRMSFSKMTDSRPESSWRGPTGGDFAGIPATGKRMKVYDFAMYLIAEGKFTDVWSLVDMQRLRNQLGA
jgi:predicted ester cyclase